MDTVPVQQKRRALVLDPFASSQKSILAALAPLRNLETICFGKAEDALQEVRRQPPDLFLLNLEVTDLHPIRIIQRLRANPITRRISIVICSRRDDKQIVLKTIAEGIDHFVSIPFDSSSFLKRIEDILSHTEGKAVRQYRQAPCRIPSKVYAFGKLSYIDEKKLRIESNVKLRPGDSIRVVSPIFTELNLESVVHNVSAMFTDDLYYHYQQAATLEPQLSADERGRLKHWLADNKSLSVPKKAKILFIDSRTELVERFFAELQNAPVSARHVSSLREALDEAAFIRPRVMCLDPTALVPNDVRALQTLIGQFINPQNRLLIAYGPHEPKDPNLFSGIFPDRLTTIYHEQYEDMVTPAVRLALPPQPTTHTEPSRIYFSKLDPHALILFQMDAAISAIGEDAISMILDHPIYPGTNLQLDTTLPGKKRMETLFLHVSHAKDEIKVDRTFSSCSAHFLALSDVDAAHIRKFVIDQDLAERRKQMASAPKTDSISPPSPPSPEPKKP